MQSHIHTADVRKRRNIQSYQKNVTTIVCTKYEKNCASYEKAVTTSEILTEYTIRSCTTFALNNCRLWKSENLGERK